MIATLESNPYPLDLTRTSTAFQQVKCEAIHGPSFPPLIRNLVERAEYDDIALDDLAHALVGLDGMQGRVYGALIATTQAVDLVSGGIKVNALPERSEVVVNHRIAQERFV